MRALVTDITGPVGRRVAGRLVAAGWHVTGVQSRERADPVPEGVQTRGWPRKPGAFGHSLSGLSLAVVAEMASPVEAPELVAERIAGLIGAAAKAGVDRLIALNSAAVYAPDAMRAGTVTEAGPFASRETADPLTRAAMRLERAVAEASGEIDCTVLRTLPTLARDCPQAHTLIGDMWRTGRPPEGPSRYQGIDADDLADAVILAARAPAAAGRAMNIAGPIAVTAEAAAAEIRRLGLMLVDDTETGIRVRPPYPQVPPVLATGLAASLIGAHPSKRIWVSFAEVLQELIRHDRASGRLPPVRTGLPPALAAIEAGRTPLEGQVAVVTEAETPAAVHLVGLLLRLGARVSVVARKGEALERCYPSFAESGALTMLAGDMALTRDVRALAARLCAEHERIDLLFNTAVRLYESRAETDEGNECCLAANLLGPFLLINLLADALRAAPQPRVLTVISDIYADSPVDLQDLQGRVVYAPVTALGRAHAGLAMCASVLAELGAAGGLSVTTFVPRPERSETWRLPPLPEGDDLVGAQELQRRETLRNRTIMQMTSPRDVASHIADLALGPASGGQAGGFLGFDGPATPAPHVQDRAAATELWTFCRSLTGLGS